VSEYQYYDFRAIDRALTRAEIAELRSISTRAAITSTSFTNHYEWGDLKADPLDFWRSTSTRFFTLQTGEHVNFISAFRSDWLTTEWSEPCSQAKLLTCEKPETL